MKTTPPNIKKNIHHLEKDIRDIDKQLTLILNLIQAEESIQPYESTYCTNCDKSCGRTNAEIYNCIMERMNQTGDDTDKKQYTKDFLEKDLQHLIDIIKTCKKNLEAIKKNY